MAKANANSFYVGSKDLTAAGTAEQLETGEGTVVPNEFTLTVKAKSTNTGNLWLGESKAKAEANHWKLQPNESTELDVGNTNQVWFDAAVSSEGIEFGFERKLS